MSVGIDLADVIERTRKVKRRLCMGPLNLSSDSVFKGEFLDVAALEELKDTIVQDEEHSPEPDEVRECAGQLEEIIRVLKDGPPRPSDRDLCERFVKGKIDARTVIQITSWTEIELYDTCTGFGFIVPDIRWA